MTSPHVPDLRTPRSDPPLTPWWAWIVLASLTAGVSLAGLVYSRQAGHIAATRETADQVREIDREVREVKSDVVFLRGFVDEVRDRADSNAESNRRRIEAVEREAVPGVAAEGPRP